MKRIIDVLGQCRPEPVNSGYNVGSTMLKPSRLDVHALFELTKEPYEPTNQSNLRHQANTAAVYIALCLSERSCSVSFRNK
jgi:hypothetical protein